MCAGAAVSAWHGGAVSGAGAVHARYTRLLLQLDLTIIPTEAAFAPTLLAGIAIPSGTIRYMRMHLTSCLFHNLLGVPLQHGGFTSSPAFQLRVGKPHCSPPAGPRPTATAHRPPPSPGPTPTTGSSRAPARGPAPRPGPAPRAGGAVAAAALVISPLAACSRRGAGECPVAVPAR